MIGDCGSRATIFERCELHNHFFNAVKLKVQGHLFFVIEKVFIPQIGMQLSGSQSQAHTSL
jgi:hypothetical protein